MTHTIFPDGYSAETGWTPRNLALKRHGHDVGSCDYDVIIHFDSCRKCRDAAQVRADELDYADAILAWEDGIRSATAADRAKYNIPPVRAIKWARRVLGLDRQTDPDDLPFE